MIALLRILKQSSTFRIALTLEIICPILDCDDSLTLVECGLSSTRGYIRANRFCIINVILQKRKTMKIHISLGQNLFSGLRKNSVMYTEFLRPLLN